MSVVPHMPFRLLIRWRNNKQQVVGFDTLAMLEQAIKELRPSLVASYEASIVLDTGVLIAPELRRNR